MGTVVELSGVLDTSCAFLPRSAALGQSSPSFNLRDRIELGAWSGVGRRAVIISCEMGAFAMLYDQGRSWASWGVVRQPRGILLWNCVSHVDVDRFDTMADALESLACTIAPMPAQKPVENVVSLMSRRDARVERRSAPPVAVKRTRPGA